ncbi:MAG: glycosyltransferase family 87 protein [Terracidiphilus sp.]|jgi:hypothetical protein
MASKLKIPGPEAEHDFADLAIVGVTALALAFTTLFLCVMPLANFAGGRDFVVYWATGQQLVHHASPYDPEEMARTELAAGFPPQAGVLYMRNPPWDLPLALPLGFIGVQAGALLWSLVLLACLLLSVRILWRMHGSSRSCLHWLGVSFAPALLCLLMGQTSLFALLGYVLFLDLHRRRPFLAGASLWLCALKPQLFLPFGVVLLAWILFSRTYKLLAGLAVALAASCAAAFCIAPAAWRDYARMMRTAGIENAHIPCLSVALRFWLSPQTAWLTYLPAALACVWALSCYWPRRHAWDWMKDGSVVMLVSLVTAPYSWVYDDCLAIPALLEGAYSTRSRILLAVLPFGSVVMSAELLFGIKIPTSYFLWTSPVWLAWYLAATRIMGMKAVVAHNGSAEIPDPLS